MNRQWLEHVERELACRHLPRRKIQRLLGELGDHLADLETAAGADRPASDRSIAAQLGQPDELADAALESHLATSYAARHPRLAFLVLPIPLTLLGWAVAVVALIGAFNLADHLPWISAAVRGRPAHTWPATILWLVSCLDLLVRVAPPAVCAAVCSAWATQLGSSRRWRFAACLLIALMAGLLHTSLVLPEAPGQGRWSVGLGFPVGRDQLLQMWIPLLVAVWYTCRQDRSPTSPSGITAQWV